MFSAIFCANKQSHGDIEKMDACIQFSLCHYDAQRDRANVIREVLIRRSICESKSDRANVIREVLIRAKYMRKQKRPSECNSRGAYSRTYAESEEI